jgi:hypothetical protein
VKELALMVEPTRKSQGGEDRALSPWTAREARRAADLWKTGLTAAEIACVLGKSRNAVLGKIARLGLSRSGRTARGPDTTGGSWSRATAPVPRHRRFAWSREHQARLVRHWKDGLATDEIAARLGCSETLVVERAAAAGLASVEAPERHSSPRWFARNDARFRAAMQWAVDQGLVTLPRPVAGSAPRREQAHGG